MYFKSPEKEESKNVTQPTVATTKTKPKMEIINSVRIWGISFYGNGDLLIRIGRTEELTLVYGSTLNVIA